MADASRNIVILPPPAVIAEAERRSHLVTELAGQNKVVLDHTNQKWPHLTLYQFGLPADNVGDVEFRARRAIHRSGVRSLTVTVSGYQIYGGTGIFWMAERDQSLPDPLQQLHERLIDELNELREGVVLEQHRGLFAADSGLSPSQRKNLGRYGYPTAMGEYLPHVTIGDVSHAARIIKDLPPDPIEFTVTELHITAIGPYGTCPGSLVTIPLK